MFCSEIKEIQIETRTHLTGKCESCSLTSDFVAKNINLTILGRILLVPPVLGRLSSVFSRLENPVRASFSCWSQLNLPKTLGQFLWKCKRRLQTLLVSEFSCLPKTEGTKRVRPKCAICTMLCLLLSITLSCES